MKKLLLSALCALLLLSLFACNTPSKTPNEEESSAYESTADAETIVTSAEAITKTASEKITESETVTETETASATGSETEAETWISEIKTLRGCLQGNTENGLLKVKLSSQYKGERNVIVYVLTENFDDFYMWDDVILTCDFNRPIETMPTGEDILVAESMEYDIAIEEKPVIYLYPQTPTEVSVTLTLDGRLTCTYPDYESGWDNFTAHSDGTLLFPDGKEYYCLYWEGIQAAEWDFSQGFCVKGEDTAAFLEWALAEQGLTPREANEFIIYWLPRMQGNPYNIISFQTDAYTSTAVLEITPQPDSLLRICMAYYATDEAVEIEAQSFDGFARKGFVAVEWGGVAVNRP